MTEHFGDDLGVDVAGEEQGGTRVPQVVEARLGRSARSPNLGCGELRAECFACSNRAATRVNLLKRREMRQRRNTTICRCFAMSRNLQQPIFCLHTAEVAGSIPASPTSKSFVLQA